jgi:hypothetical protein
MKTINVIQTSGILLTIAAVSFMASCKKEIKPVAKATPVKSSFYDFTHWKSALTDPIQNFQLDASKGGTIRGDRGYTFTIAPSSLKDRNGNTVSGTVKVELIEVTNVIEMMATGAQTEAVDGILGSAGMFKLEITQNWNRLQLNKSKPIQATVTANPDAQLDNIEVFQGRSESDNTDTVIRWLRGNGPRPLFADSLEEFYDSLKMVWEKKRVIKFELTFLGWCNLDAYFNSPTGESIQVKVSGVEDHIDTRVIMHLIQNNLKGLIDLNPIKNVNNPIDYTSKPYNLPLGWEIRIIVVTRDKDYNLSYETRTITNTQGIVHEFKNLKPISDKDLEEPTHRNQHFDKGGLYK